MDNFLLTCHQLLQELLCKGSSSRDLAWVQGPESRFGLQRASGSSTAVQPALAAGKGRRAPLESFSVSGVLVALLNAILGQPASAAAYVFVCI